MKYKSDIVKCFTENPYKPLNRHVRVYLGAPNICNSKSCNGLKACETFHRKPLNPYGGIEGHACKSL